MLHLKPNAATLSGRSDARDARPIGSADAGPYRVLVYDQDQFTALDWPQAADDATLDSYVYQSREFLRLWLSTIGHARGSHAYLVVIEGGEQVPIMWLPLVIERQFGLSHLRFPDGGMADYNGPVLKREVDIDPYMATIWTGILATLPHVDVIDFVKMPATIWNRANPLLRIGPMVREDEGYYLPIAGSFDQYMADPARKPRARKLRQLFRKLERNGRVLLGEVRDLQEVAQARAFVEHHKTRQYLRTLGFNQFDKPGVRAFVSGMCEPAALDSFTRMTVLTYDGAVIGAQLDFVTPRRQQGFMTTFDAETYGFYSPGRQVQLHLIERAFTDKLRIFDLGHGDNPYKHPWMTDVLQLYSFGQGRSWRGHLFLRLRVLRRKLPVGIMRRVADRFRQGSARHSNTAGDET